MTISGAECRKHCHIIIIKRISRAPIYHTRWQHRALYNNTNHTHTHMDARTHARTCRGRGGGRRGEGEAGGVGKESPACCTPQSLGSSAPEVRARHRRRPRNEIRESRLSSIRNSVFRLKLKNSLDFLFFSLFFFLFFSPFKKNLVRLPVGRHYFVVGRLFYLSIPCSLFLYNLI